MASSESTSATGFLWRRVALFAIILLGAVLRLWNLSQNGWGNEYYTAGVRSMTISWHNFFYNSFDPAGFVSVDKPPVALWIQAASVELFGFHGFSLFLPQVLGGLGAILILYHLVQCRFGAMAGLLAALFLAVTPISVAIDRSNNTDSCLVLVLLLAAWALIRATEKGNRSLLMLSMAIIGLGFNVKMLAAYVVLPTFVLVYFLGAPLALQRRLADLVISGVVLVAVSLSWVLAYDLTAPENRPFAGTTKNNSMLELAIGPYAVGRFVPPVRSSNTARSYPKADNAVIIGTQQAAGGETGGESRPRTGLLRLLVRAPAGPLRLADGQLAGQVAWLAPLALMGLVLGAFQYRFGRPLAPEHLALLLWFGWAFTYGIVYSFAGGIMHLYYLATMAPPLAALAGIGVASLRDRYLRKGWGALLLPATLLVTAAWQLHIETSALDLAFGDMVNPNVFFPLMGLISDCLLHSALLAGTLAAVGGLFVIALRQAWNRRRRAVAAVALGIGLSSVLVVPMAWVMSSVLVAGHGVLPSADMPRLACPIGRSMWSWYAIQPPPYISKLIGFLRANSADERYLLATSSARLAAPIIIRTGEPVMAMGGFHGLDPILTPEKLAAMVKANQVRFVMQGDLPIISRRLGAEAAGKAIADWVEANGKLVDASLWRSYGDGGHRLRLYDLRPDVALFAAPSQ